MKKKARICFGKKERGGKKDKRENNFKKWKSCKQNVPNLTV